MAPGPRAFISYARSDGEAAATGLRRRLQAEHPELTLWQDRINLEGGVGWWRQITEALDHVEIFVLVLTPAAVSSTIIQKEWRYARQQGVRVCPVLADAAEQFDFSALPRWMSKVHCYDLVREWDTFLSFLKSAPRETRVPFMAPDLRDDFVARPLEYEAVKATVLDGSRLNPIATTIALQGAGGFGKTTLAAALCHDDDIISAFDDGVLWVTIGERPALQQQLSKLYAAVTGERPAFVDAEDAAMELAVRLEDKQCLMVLDDVWDANDVRLFLRGGRNCARVITTRRHQVVSALNAERVLIDEMTADEAVAMLLVRLETQPVDARPFRQLADRLGEWPLLLRLAASQVRERLDRGDSIGGALGFVNQALDRRGAVAFDRANAAARHDAVQTTVAASLALLDVADRTRVVELSVFAESQAIPLTAASALWGLDAFETEEIVQRLDDASLVDFDLKRASMRLHDVLRAHFRAQLADPKAIHERLLASWGSPQELPDAFAWRWYPWHLAQAGRGLAVQQLLLSPGWMAAKLHCTDIHDLLRDFAWSTQSATLDSLRDALRLSMSALGRDPSQLAAQLSGRLARGPSAEIDRLLDTLDASATTLRLRLVEPTLTHPGQALMAIMKGHAGGVEAMDISLDGLRLATAGSDRTVRVWDLQHWRAVREMAGHEGAVHAVKLLRDGRRALSGGEDRALRMWDTTSGECLMVLRGHYESIRSLAVAPDDQTAASVSEDGTVRVWDLRTGRSATLFKSSFHQMCGVGYLPDGSRLVFGGGDGTVRVMDVVSRREVATIEGQGIVRAVAVSPDGSVLLIGADDGSLRVCDLATGDATRVFDGHARSIGCVAFSGDGQWAASGGSDRLVKVWSLQSPAVRETLAGHAGPVQAVAFLPGDDRILLSSADRTVRAWRRDSVAGRHERVTSTVAVTGLACSRDGMRVLADSTGTGARVRDWRLGSERPLDGHSKRIQALWMSDDGRVGLTASSDRIACVWDLESGTLTRQLRGHISDLVAIAMTPDGSRAASLSLDRTIRVWDVRSGATLRVLAGPRSARAVEALQALTVEFEQSAGLPLEIGRFPLGRTTRMLLTAEGTRIVIGDDSWFGVWDLRTGRLDAIEVPGFQLEELAVDGGIAVAGSILGLVCQLDLDSCRLIRMLEPSEGTARYNRILDVLVDAGRQRAITAMRNGQVTVWDLLTGVGTVVCEAGGETVDALAIAPTGRFAYSVTGDTMTATDLATPGTVSRVSLDHRITAFAVASDGNRVAIGDESGQLHLASVRLPADGF